MSTFSYSCHNSSLNLSAAKGCLWQQQWQNIAAHRRLTFAKWAKNVNVLFNFRPSAISPLIVKQPNYLWSCNQNNENEPFNIYKKQKKKKQKRSLRAIKKVKKKVILRYILKKKKIIDAYSYNFFTKSCIFF